MQALLAIAGQPGPRLHDRTPPPVAADQIRIAVAAAAVNPIDNFVATGEVTEPFGLPSTVGLGWDVSGTVAEVGADVTEFAVGDKVAALHDDIKAPLGTHAESIAVPSTAVARIPGGLDLETAGAVPLNALTADQALALLGPAEGRTLLVTGAAGAVGGYAVALAARGGWRVTGFARSGDAEWVRGAGAHDFVSELPGPSFDAVLDAAALQEPAITAVRDGGAFVGVLPPMPVPSERDITVSTVEVRSDGSRLAELLELSREGVLEPRVAGTTPLAEAATAYAKVAGGGQRGRWLLVP